MKNQLTKTVGSCPWIIAPLLVLLTSGSALAQSGPATPKVDGTSPLLGYIIAVILIVLLVVVSIIPSKRHVEDT